MADKALFGERLRGLSDEDLRAECEKYIWLSAYAANNPRSEYHWMCDATYAEGERRGKPEIYKRAYRTVLRQEGYA